MARPKLNVKELLIKKGEYIALGVAGVGLAILLLWGVTTGVGAANPAEISKEFTTKSASIQQKISDPNDPMLPDPLGASMAPGKSAPYNRVPVSEFAYNGPLFDPVGRPDTKRENPIVWGIEDYQVDLILGAMPGFDIIFVDGKDPQIAVRVEKKLEGQAKEKLQAAFDKIKGRTARSRAAHQNNQPGPGIPPGDRFIPKIGAAGPDW